MRDGFFIPCSYLLTVHFAFYYTYLVNYLTNSYTCQYANLHQGNHKKRLILTKMVKCADYLGFAKWVEIEWRKKKDCQNLISRVVIPQYILTLKA